MKALESYRDVRTLVLGGGGFIGTWVAAALCRVGAQVVVSARDPQAARAALAARGARCDVRAYDLARPGEVVRLLSALRPAIVFNLAGYGVDPSERDEPLALRLNRDLVAELAQNVAPDHDWRGQVLVHAGSALEFGEQSGDFSDPWKCHPTTLYGRSKLAGSEALRDASVQRGLKAVCARLYTVYGPGEHSTRLVPTLLAAAHAQGEIPLTAGLQKRDFLYVSDVAHGLLRLGAVHEPIPERALNIATGQLTSVRFFVETAADTFGIDRSRLRFGVLPTRAEEMQHDPVSTARLEALTNWKPTTTIAQGLRETAAFARVNQADDGGA